MVIASLFGGKVEQRDDNPPWVRHFETYDEFSSIFDRDPLDFSQGICPQLIERYRFYRDVLATYPNLQKCIRIVLPDLQGPLDSLELLRGSSVYEDFIMDPEMVDKGLGLMAQAQVGLAKHLQQYTTEKETGFSHQHAVVIKGNILIRNDSAIMVSPDMYAAQVAHHDEFVMKEMRGGAVHSCGKIDFNVPEIFKLPSLESFDFGAIVFKRSGCCIPVGQGKENPPGPCSPFKRRIAFRKNTGKIPNRCNAGLRCSFV